jgi:hypothetical protein
MYEIGRRVYVRSQDVVGEVADRQWLGGNGTPRRASYLIEYRTRPFRDSPLRDLTTGSDDLQPADYNCDGCGKWRAGMPHGRATDPEGGTLAAFCFLCARGIT